MNLSRDVSASDLAFLFSAQYALVTVTRQCGFSQPLLLFRHLACDPLYPLCPLFCDLDACVRKIRLARPWVNPSESQTWLSVLPRNHGDKHPVAPMTGRIPLSGYLRGRNVIHFSPFHPSPYFTAHDPVKPPMTPLTLLVKSCLTSRGVAFAGAGLESPSQKGQKRG